MSRAVLLAFLLAGPALAAPPDVELKRARDRLDYGSYADALKIVQRLLDERRLTNDDQLVDAWRIAGIAHYYLKARDEARGAFVQLLAVNPDFALDAFLYPPKLVDFFDRVKADNEALLGPIREQKRRVEEERQREEEARKRLLAEQARREAEEKAQPREVRIERTVAQNSYVVAWLPFGAGQFQNGDTLLGSVLAGGQIVTGLASLLGYLQVRAYRKCIPYQLGPVAPGGPILDYERCGIEPKNLNLAESMNTVKWVAGGLFWSLVVYGIVDAHLSFEPTTPVSETREEVPLSSPPEPRVTFAPFVSPHGGGALLTLEF